MQDGVLEDPTRCMFDPKVLECKAADGPSCLTPPQVAAARKLYSPATNPRTKKEIFGPLFPGSELLWAQSAGPVTDDNIVERISQAKTPAEHEAIAAYYNAEAATAAAKVKEHEAMVKAYGGSGMKTMNRHCEQLLQTYRSQQKDVETLAKEHADMAAKAK